RGSRGAPAIAVVPGVRSGPLARGPRDPADRPRPFRRHAVRTTTYLSNVRAMTRRFSSSPSFELLVHGFHDLDEPIELGHAQKLLQPVANVCQLQRRARSDGGC